MKATYNVSNVYTPPIPKIQTVCSYCFDSDNRYLATDDVPSQEAFEGMHKRGVINLFMMPFDRSVFDGEWFIEYASTPKLHTDYVH